MKRPRAFKLIVVSVQVYFQVAILGKRSVTYVALVGLFARVQTQMLVEIAALREELAAEEAFVRLFGRVRSVVHLEIVTLTERFGTYFALVGSLA